MPMHSFCALRDTTGKGERKKWTIPRFFIADFAATDLRVRTDNIAPSADNSYTRRICTLGRERKRIRETSNKQKNRAG